MPALFSLGQKTALQAIQQQLHPRELLLAYLDDVYAVVQPDRVRAVYDIMAHHLHTHTREFGMRPASPHRTWTHWAPMCGLAAAPCQANSKGSPSSAHQWEPPSTWPNNFNTPPRATKASSNASQLWMIYRLPGYCSCFVRAPAATTSSAPPPRNSHKSSHYATTQQWQHVCKLCSASPTSQQPVCPSAASILSIMCRHVPSPQSSAPRADRSNPPNFPVCRPNPTSNPSSNRRSQCVAHRRLAPTSMV